MMRWLSIADRGGVTLVAVLCVAAATPLAAQQASGAAPQAGASAAPQTSSAGTVLPGPRLRPEWWRAEPSVADSIAAGPVAAAAVPRTVTITITTLVLLGIIALLLITR